MNAWIEENREPTIKEALMFVTSQANYNPYKAKGTNHCLSVLFESMSLLEAAPLMYKALQRIVENSWLEEAPTSVQQQAQAALDAAGGE